MSSGTDRKLQIFKSVQYPAPVRNSGKVGKTHSVCSVGDPKFRRVHHRRESAEKRQCGPANVLFLRGAKHDLRRLVKASPVGHAVDLLCAARPQAIVVYRTSRKFQDADVKYQIGISTNAYPRGSGVSRLPISSLVIAATISSIHALSLLIVSSSARSSVSVMLQDRMTCRSSSSPSRSEVISSRMPLGSKK